MAKITGVGGGTSGYLDNSRELKLRVDGLPKLEDSQASETANRGTLVGWPIAPELLIDYWMGNPWLAAIGNLLADAVSSASYELVAREADLEGNLIENRPRSTAEKKQDKDYARGMAWLSREDVGGDGVGRLDLKGLMWTMSRVFDQTGNIFAEVVRDRAATRPLRLQHLLPQFLRYQVQKDGELRLYQQDAYRGEAHYVTFGTRKRGDKDQREFIHQRLPNTVSTFYGLPLWTEARDSVAVDNAHRGYLKAFFKSHAAPRWLIEITQNPAWLGAEATQTEVEGLYALIKGYLDANRGDMAGRNLTVHYPGGMLVKVTALDQKIEDPTFGEVGKSMRDEILSVRHISLIDVGLPDNSNRATSAVQAENFRRQTLEPFSSPVVSLINSVLHAPEPHGLGLTTWDFKLHFERAEDTLQRIESVIKATGRPVFTADEGRAVLGYEARGDDELYVASSMVPVLALGEGGPDSG